MKKVSFYTLGCKVNQYETEAMEELFETHGYEVVPEGEWADIYVINTCTVTNLSDRKSRQFIGKAVRNNPDAVIAAVGCYSQVAPDKVAEIEAIDIILGTAGKERIVELCESFIQDRRRINTVGELKNEGFSNLQVARQLDRTRASIKIQDGCNRFCSYCIIPYARGPIRSRKLRDIVLEAKRLADAGYREVVLTGIHVSSFGLDSGEGDLATVIEEVAQVKEIRRIRLSSLEQGIITRDFMERVQATGKLCNHFHLSLQSGSDTVLKRMNRKYETHQYAEKIDLIRTFEPQAGITTDIIVGFPGETDAEFEETCAFVEKMRFSRIHVFKYSPRIGTPAAKMAHQVDGSVKNMRSEILSRLEEELRHRFMEEFIGRELPVLAEEKTKGQNSLMGYSDNYLRIRFEGQRSQIGSIQRVLVEKREGDLLVGRSQ